MQNSDRRLPRKVGIAVRIVVFVVIFVLLAEGLAWLVFPNNGRVAGRMREFNALEEAPDNLMLGTSMTYRSFVPLYMEELTGDTFFDMSLGAEPLTASYYLLRYAIDQGKAPKRVFLLMTFRRLTDDDGINTSVNVFQRMPWSLTKLDFLVTGISPGRWPEAVLKAYRAREYFTWKRIKRRLSTLTVKAADEEEEDDTDNEGTEAPTGYEKYNVGGYNYTDVASDPLSVEAGTKITFHEDLVLPKNMTYFNRIVSLCKQQGIDLVLISRPRLPQNLMGSVGYGEFHDYVQRLADENGLSFWDLTYLKGDILTVGPENYLDERHGNATLAFPMTEILAQMYNEYTAGTLDLSDWLFDTWDDYLALYGDLVGLAPKLSQDGGSVTVRLTTGDPKSWVGRIRVLQGDGETWETLQDWTDWSGASMDFSLENLSGNASMLRFELRNADGELVQYKEISAKK